jgi:hypothetical protein
VRLSRWCPPFLLFLLLHALEAVGAEYGFEVKRAELVPVEGTYVLNADVDFRFSQTAIEALEHGVPLTVVLRFKISRHRDYWLDETVFSESRRIRIRYHPLAKSFQLLYETAGVPQSFAGLTALLDTMGEIRGWRAVPVDALEKGSEYTARLATSLDIEALPLPLRPVAYVSPSWYLGSPWFQWRVEN